MVKAWSKNKGKPIGGRWEWKVTGWNKNKRWNKDVGFKM